MDRFENRQRIRLIGMAVMLRLGAVVFGAEPALAQRAGTVVLQVEVTEGGQPVAGLTAEDFVIRDKGKAVPVVEVREVDLASGAEDLPEEAYRQLFLVFDLEFSSPRFVMQAIDVAKELISSERLDRTQVLIAAHEPSTGLRIAVNLTHDRDRLVEMLDIMRREHEARLGNSGPSAGPVISGDDLMASRVRNTESDKGIVQQEQGRILKLIRTLSRLEPLTRSVPGSSQVVLFSPGFDSSVILGNQATDQFDAAWSARSSEAAAQGDVAAVDGATRYGGGLVEEALFGMLSDYDRSGVPIQAVEIELTGVIRPDERGARGPNGLTIMARRTGGQVRRGTREQLLQEIQTLQSAESIYLLTFQPRSVDSGRYRKLDVRLRKPAKTIEILAPPGYYVP